MRGDAVTLTLIIKDKGKLIKRKGRRNASLLGDLAFTDAQTHHFLGGDDADDATKYLATFAFAYT